MRILALLAVMTVALSAGGRAWASDEVPVPARPSEPDSVDVYAATRDVFEGSCVHCHAGDRVAAGLNLGPQRFASALIGVESTQLPGFRLVDVEAPEKSYLLMKIRGDDGIKGSRMPLRGPRLEPAVVALIERWIQEEFLTAASDTADVPPPQEAEE